MHLSVLWKWWKGKMSKNNVDAGDDRRLQSPLDNVNVRLVMLYINQQLETLLDEYKFEIYDEVTRANIAHSIETYTQSFLVNMKDRGDIDNFAVAIGYDNSVDITIKPNISYIPISISINEDDNSSAFERAMGIVTD